MYLKQNQPSSSLEQITSKRDGLIDFFKGLLILWVIQIHTVFWSGMNYIPEAPRQASLLIDVSVFFFISGYLTKPTRFIHSFKKSAKQFINLYFTYLLFSCLLLSFLSLVFILKDKSTPDITEAIISMLRLNPTGELWGDIYVYAGSVWYIAVYLSLLVFVPLVMHFSSFRSWRIGVLFFLLLAFAVSSYWDLNYDFLFTQTLYLFFYLFIYMLGVAYRVDEQNISIRYLKLTFLLNLVLCLIIFFHFDGAVLHLQSEKFPPTLKYLIYSLLLIQIFAIVKQAWHYSSLAATNQLLQFLEWCGRNCYYIYLFQGLVCTIPGFFIPVLLSCYVPILAIYIMSLTFNTVFTLFLTYFVLKGKSISLRFVQTFQNDSMQ